jgi:glycosyltransferase involved in cell wall biosynthesis
MKKIYLEITPFFPTHKSFRGSFVYDQVQALQRTGFFNEVIVLRPSNVNSEYEYQGIKIYLFKTRNLPSNILPGLFDQYNKKSFLKRLEILRISLSDIIVAHGHVAAQALYVNAIKELNPKTQTVIQYHDPDPFSIRLGRLKNQLWHRKIVARHSIKLCAPVGLHVGVSQKVINNLLSFPFSTVQEEYDEYRYLLKGMEKLIPIKTKNTFVLYNGVDKNIFYPDKKKIDSPFRIGCIANFIDWKDQITLIKAVEILIKADKEIELVFIGTGRTLISCIDYVNERQLNHHIVFQTEMNHDKLRSFYNSLDIFVLPSYFEGFGCVYTEAYACDVPFIAVKGQGISELINDDEQERWLIEKQDYQTLSKQISNYRKHKYKQTLTIDTDIDKLISQFVNYLNYAQ